MKNSECILYSENKGVATLSLNRPEVRNAFDDKTILLLLQHLEAIDKDNDIKILILKGEGAHFSAGGDIHWMHEMAKANEKDNEEDALKLAQLLHALFHLNKPTIVITQGSVFGGAIGLVACCDIAIANEDSIFCCSEVKLGMVPAVVSPYVIAAIGARAARRYMLTAERFSATEALHLGLIHEIVETNTLEKRLHYFIDLLESNGPQALKNTKTLIHTLTSPQQASVDPIAYTAHLLATTRRSKEAAEGLAAFLEKRKPQWQDT